MGPFDPSGSPQQNGLTFGGPVGYGLPGAWAAAPPILSSQITLAGLLVAFRRRWRLAVALGSLLAAVSAVVAWYCTSATSHLAVAMLRIEASQPVFFPGLGEGRTDFSMYQRSQVALIKSRMV